MADATELIERQSERAKVESWRLHVLMEAGYPLPLAEKLAAALDADLHEAVELVGQGCDPRTPPRSFSRLLEPRPERVERRARTPPRRRTRTTRGRRRRR